MATPTHFEMTSTEPRRLSRRESELSEARSAVSAGGDSQSNEHLVNAIRDSLSKPALSANQNASNTDNTDNLPDNTATDTLLPQSEEVPKHFPPKRLSAMRFDPSLTDTGAVLLSPTMVATPVRTAEDPSSSSYDDLLDYDMQAKVSQSRLKGLQPWLLAILCLIQAIGTVVMVGFSGKLGFGGADYAPPQVMYWASVYCVTALLSLLVTSIAFVLGPLREMFPDVGDLEDKVSATGTFGFPTSFSLQLGCSIVDTIMLALGTGLMINNLVTGQVIRSNASYIVIVGTIVAGWVCIFTFFSAAISTYTILRPLWKVDVVKREAKRSGKASRVAPTGQKAAGSYGMGAPSVAMGQGRLIPAGESGAVEENVAKAAVNNDELPPVPRAPIIPAGIAAKVLMFRLPFVGSIFKKATGFMRKPRQTSDAGFQNVPTTDDEFVERDLNQSEAELEGEKIVAQLDTPQGSNVDAQAGKDTKGRSFLDFISPRGHSGVAQA